MKKKLATLLALSMTAALTACGSPEQTATTAAATTAAKETAAEKSAQETTQAAKEPVTITLYPANANLTSGKVGGWLGDYLLEQGIILEVWAYSEEKSNAIFASGELPDIMYLAKGADFEVLSNSGYLLDLEGYMDQLPHVAESESMMTAVNYTKEFVSDGKLTMLPTLVGDALPTSDTGRFALKLDWDVYESIGCPKFSNLDELIPILKEMQQAHPTTADGVKTYGMHLFNSNDNNYFFGINSVCKVLGYNYDNAEYFLLDDVVNNRYESMLEEDGVYKYGLKFYNKLYREGLLDPDSMTQDRNAAKAKIEDQEAGLAGWVAIPGWEKNGYYPVYFDECKIPYGTGTPYGGGDYIAVSAKSEHIDTALKLLDLLANPDEAMIIRNGPQGELWDFDAAGTPVLTEKGKKYFLNGEQVTLENGETYTLFNTSQLIAVGTETSYGTTVAIEGWDEYLDAQASSDTMNAWRNDTGYNSFMELVEDKDAVIKEPFSFNVTKFVSKESDDMAILKAAIKDTMVQASWKMVYAESDEEFEKLWTDMVAECEGLEIQKIIDWRLAELEKATQIRDSLAN